MENESYEYRLWVALNDLVVALKFGAPEETVWREVSDAERLLDEGLNKQKGV